MSEMAPSPALIFDTLTAYQKSGALKAGIDLDLFSAIAAGKTRVRELAESCGAAERGVRILCDFLTAAGFLTKQGDRYGLTRDSAIFLDRRSPAYAGAAADFLLNPVLLNTFADTASCVRKGGTLMPEEGSVTDANPIWVVFARAMAGLTVGAARDMAEQVGGDPHRSLKVLDIAAGHGNFGITIARQFPNARITALDWAPVLEVARENARAAGVEDRLSTIAGSAFTEEFGDGYDLVLITNFLHHFNPETNLKLLQKVTAALKPGGRIFILEFVPNEDRISPPPSAMFSLVMLATTPEGDAYTHRQLDDLCRRAGCSGTELCTLPHAPQQLIIAVK